MKLLLLNPPNHKYDLLSLAPPFGLLCLARAARQLDCDVELLDLDLVSLEWNDDSVTFYERALDLILYRKIDVLALTSMGINSHVSLQIAELAKRADPSIVTVVGGAHFSAIGADIRRHFPYIDHVIVGIGEEKLSDLLTSLDPSLNRRRLRSGPEFHDINSHPHSCYDLVDLKLYFAKNEKRVINYQNGHGCSFHCGFCYSPSFYSSFGQARIEDSINDLMQIREMGAGHVFFVQDNLINDTDWASEFLVSLAASRFDLTWNCYISIPRLTKMLLAQLANAGCVSIYLGLDAVTNSQKKYYRKNFFHEDKTFELLDYATSKGVVPTCAFIVDVYRYDNNEIEVTLQTALDCSLKNLPIRINTFTRYQGTQAYTMHRQTVYSEHKVRLMMDCAEVVSVNPIARNYPNLFPFHSTEINPTLWLARLTLIYVANVVITDFPEDFGLFARKKKSSLISILEEFVNQLPMLFTVPKLTRKSWVRSKFAEYCGVSDTV